MNITYDNITFPYSHITNVYKKICTILQELILEKILSKYANASESALSRIGSTLPSARVQTIKFESEVSNVSGSSAESVGSASAASSQQQQQRQRKHSRFDEALHIHLTSLFQKSSQAVQAEIERLRDLNAQLNELCLDPTVALYSAAAAALYHSLLAPIVSSALLARIAGSSCALLSWPRVIRLLRERAHSLKRSQASQGSAACYQFKFKYSILVFS